MPAKFKGELLFASLIYSSYYGYNHNKKKKSLSGIIHKYNRIYQHIVPTPSDEIYIKDLPPSHYLNRLIKEIEKN